MELLWKSPMRTQVIEIVLALALVGLVSLGGAECRKGRILQGFEYTAINCRAHSASLTDFGGVGDGKTLNTKAFRNAINQLSQYGSKGGAQLFVPAWKMVDLGALTSQATSRYTSTKMLFFLLPNTWECKASEDATEWPVIAPLPSYGRGRDTKGGRYISFIFGTNLTDVVVTGDNGTIDGQGALWWQQFHKGKLKYTRPYMIEILHSDGIQISNLTLVNSPAWNVHPVYSSNILVQGITIIAPVTSPNTDGINPDSCTNTRIEDCYIVSGDDCVAVKSGWDEYGIKYGMPTKHLVIRRLTCISPYSAVIALGSEMSGGIQDVRAEDILAVNTESGVRIKTAVGRGGYVKDIYVRGMTMKTMKWAFWMTGNYGSHADNNYDPHALPVIQGINYKDMVAEDVKMAARLEGIAGDPFTEICISNVTIGMAAKAKKIPWTCTDVAGITSGVSPRPCDLLPDQGPKKIGSCNFPTEALPIDYLKFKKCSIA
ncbi:hypothetical protein L1049_012946 [Liquidambar formosana]|uniref:Polygalacturonase n=1 Tax=Liquidambar formosana TaxID=63359 RepID=A0AAP0RJR3_LIQFO